MNWIQRRLFKAKSDADIEDLGQVEHTIVRFKGYFISVMEQDNEIVSLGWTDDVTMYSAEIPIRDYWESKPPRVNLKTKGGQYEP